MPDTQKPPSTSRVCPNCGTRVAESAARCAVCGTELTPGGGRRAAPSRMSGRGPALTIPWPLAIATPAVFMLIGAVIIALIARSGRAFAPGAPSSTPSLTSAPSETLPPSNTPEPTLTTTPLPPVEYVIASNDTCVGLAIRFNVSVNSILELNNLPPACNNLSIGQKLLIPQPTPTPVPPSTATFTALESTRTSCELFPYTVQEGDTLAGIAANYNVTIDGMKEFNQNIFGDTVFTGLTVQVPLCRRLPTPGPTPTATPPPPYAAPNLLSPRDGSVFGLSDETIALQWAAVAVLRDNESYLVTVEDITEGTGRRTQAYTAETKYIVPSTLRPSDTSTHLFRWTVEVVRQTGTSSDGKAVYASGSPRSDPRIFGWSGGRTAPTPTS